LHPDFSEALCARVLAQLTQSSLSADQLTQVRLASNHIHLFTDRVVKTIA
jgi:hypothetical protein